MPADTARSTFAELDQQSIYRLIGERTADIFKGVELSETPVDGEPCPENLPVLALVAAFQYTEELSDSQAAEATRTRTDWKYALHLPRLHPGINVEGLCDFRRKMYFDDQGRSGFQMLLQNLESIGYLPAGKISESNDVLRLLCSRTRTEWVVEAMLEVLEALAIHAWVWLKKISRPHWYQRYSRSRPALPGLETREQMEAYAASTGQDVHYLFQRLEEVEIPGLEDWPEVKNLRRVWNQQFFLDHGEVKLRVPICFLCERDRYS